MNGDIQLDSNYGALGVMGNQGSGNLQCKENDPAPTGGNNKVQAAKKINARICKSSRMNESIGVCRMS